MPVVRVELLAGRSEAQKRAAAKAITDALVSTCGTQAHDVTVVFVDSDPGDWFVAGRSVRPGPAPLASAGEGRS